MRKFLSSLTIAGLVLSSTCFAEEKPGGEGPQAVVETPEGHAVMRGRGDLPDFIRPNSQIRFIQERIEKMLGEDVPVELKQLPFGVESRKVNLVPVGGIDCLSDRKEGWKAEEIYTLTEEQSAAMTKLRDEYQVEMGKLQEQLSEMHRAMAQQIVTLRTQYETKANDVLSEEQRKEKVALDKLATEYNSKLRENGQTQKREIDALLKQGEALAQQKPVEGDNLFGQLMEIRKQGFEFIGKIKNQQDSCYEEFKAQYLQSTTGPSHDALEVGFRKIDQRNERMRQMMGRLRPPGMPNPQEAPAQKPPKPPENGDF